MTASHLHWRDGSDRRVLVQLVDITQRCLAEQQLEHDARHDPLTGLLNRRALFAHLTGLLGTAETDLGVLSFDLDELNPITTAAGPLEVRGSLGATRVAAGLTPDPGEVLRRADEALYEAKARGRGRLVIGRSS